MPALAAAAFANAFGGAELGRTPCRPNTAAGDLAGARGVRRTIPSPWRGREKEEFGGGGHRKTASRGKQCVSSRKQKAAHANSDACRIRLPAGEEEGMGWRGGRGLPRLAGW